MTARRLAQLPGLGLTLVAGRENGERTINWAHAIELRDPTPYLSGGELLMTTGMNVGATDAEQFEYLARLSATGVAALAFDTGTTHRHVPDGIITGADELGLPVLAVPAQTPFIAITRAVIDEVTADSLRSVQRVVDQQEVMARETLRNGVPAVITALSTALSATAIVIATDGSVLAAAGHDIDRVAALCRRHVVDSRADRNRSARTSRVVADGRGYCTLQLLRATQTPRGYLAVRTEAPLTPTDRLLVSHAVALVSIELAKPAKVLDAEQRLRAAVTTLMMAEPAALEGGILRYFGFEPDDAIVVVVLSDIGPALTAEHQAQRILDARAGTYLLCTDGDALLIVLPSGGSLPAAELHSALADQVQRSLGGGLSLPGTFGTVRLCIDQARAAAQADTGHGFREFGDLGVFGLVLGNRSPAELDLLAQKVRSLEATDGAGRRSSQRLVATLETYLRHNGHLESAATDLGIHRHTLRNRLVKIAELTGSDLRTADARTELWLALKARDLRALGISKRP